MKKSTIWFLTLIMAITFMGLLYVQITYMKNMVKMRDDQFVENVQRSLYGVSTLLAQDEAKYFLDEDVARIESSQLSQSLGGIRYSITTPSGVEADLTIKGDVNTISGLNQERGDLNDHYKSMHESLKGQYLYQKGLLNEVILEILSRSSNRPIQERADSSAVNEYIRQELDNNGLSLPYEFAVVSRNGAVIYKSAGYVIGGRVDDDSFVQTLFPGDPVSRLNYLRVQFPAKDDYIISSVRFMIPSFLFTFILLVIFLYTIIVAFRQKKLTEMKNDFINNMTHEFKTPISCISLAGQMLNDDSVRKSPNMLQHISTVINDETKRLRFQVEKVLQMSMFERQKAALRLTEVDANAAIDNIINTFKLKVEKYGGRLTAQLDAEDAIVNVDEMHFTNVIFNLLDNAVKYRREDEPLQLAASTEQISGNRLQITISDNGIGIKKDDLKKIFEKFYRVSTGNRHDVKGFGLGLAYVKKMVTEFGGEIRAESEYNVGTKFIIILPLIKN